MEITNPIVAIHQPDFLPWPGFFNKYYSSDIFVINDYGQWPKDQTCYSNRVAFWVQGKAFNFTIPIIHAYNGYRTFKEMKINNSIPWRKKLWGTIQANYAKSVFYSQYKDHVHSIIMHSTESLVDYNLNGINILLKLLKLDADKMVIGSTSITHSSSVKTEKIIEVVKELNGKSYLSGQGAIGYMKNELFAQNNIHLFYNEFNEKAYEIALPIKLNPGLSTLDLIFNIGAEKTTEIISIDCKKVY